MFQFYSNRLYRSRTNFLKNRNVVCLATTTSRDASPFLNQIRVSVINITLETREKILKLQKMIDGITSKPGKYGSGVLGYTGTSNPSGSAFLGMNQATNRYIVRFLNDEGIKIFEELRNANAFGDYSLSAVEGSFQCSQPEEMSDIEKIVASLEETLKNQKKGRKSVKIKNQALEIGSKESGSFISIKPVAKGAQAVALEVNFYFKQKYAKDCGFALQANETVSLKDVVAYTILNSLKLVRSSELLLHITTTLQKNFSVSQVIATKTRKQLSKSGLYVTRSLTGILNKLKDASTAVETEALLLEWFENKLATIPPNSKDQTQIVLKLGQIVGIIQPTLQKSAKKSSSSVAVPEKEDEAQTT